jgi:hypothetical protein
MLKNFRFLVFIFSSFSLHAQLAIGYNAGVFQSKLKYFEMLNYENGLRNNGEKFIYSPLLHGLHVGFPLIRDKNKDNMMMECFSGIYYDENAKIEYFSENGNLDSSYSFQEIGTVSFLDQYSDYGNAFTTYFDYQPEHPFLFSKNNTSGIQYYSAWTVDGNNKSRLFFKSGNPEFDLIYTVLKKSTSQLEIQRVIANENNDILFREIIAFKKL